MEPIRLNKFISDSGYCSRREADKMIEQGRVMVNGKRPEVGAKVTAKDKVRVDGNLLQVDAVEPVYLLLNKPAGIETTTDTSQRENIISFTNYPERIFPVGRLDKDSEGLIILTNDGDIVNKILRAGNKHEKEYIVTVDKPINQDFVEKMSGGVSILGVNTKKCFVEQLGANKFRIILTQGMNRQIRRMCEVLGYEVQTLQRTRIMHLSLNKIPLGQWRNMTETEIAELQRLVAGSTKTEEGSIGKKRAEAPAPAKSSKPKSRSGGSPAAKSGRPGGSPKGGKNAAAGKRDKPKTSNSARGSRGASKGTATGGKGRSGGAKGGRRR
ncbi:23S rRNA pseudouridine(2604) synthase RluF [Pontibacter cellulosilyticus]|uniref:Pseudouridine synthase n=1 Tax=Pontibacter cellulosilyticus TaxID=1720253 RepID=A0A923SI53_9BACT|nr:23S rRNA pseudouridine(2604) synthase RluF [Pontibacter cellulosilyticus]MBC5991286.1 23S rRNA pseudouridine(2604) synthase RluF [Pontibacter cellulosilyticus]